ELLGVVALGQAALHGRRTHQVDGRRGDDLDRRDLRDVACRLVSAYGCLLGAAHGTILSSPRGCGRPRGRHADAGRRWVSVRAINGDTGGGPLRCTTTSH